MSNEDLETQVAELRQRVQNLASRGRIGNPVYGGPINADVTQCAKTSGPFMWLVDATHNLEVVLPVQDYVHRILDARLRVTLRPVRAATATTGSPNITTTDDSSQASSASTTNNNAQASSLVTSDDASPASSSNTTDDNAQGSNNVSTNDNAASSSSSTTNSEVQAAVGVATSIHTHQWGVFISAAAAPTIGFQNYDTWGPNATFPGARLTIAVVSGAAGSTSVPTAGSGGGAATVSVSPTGHNHTMNHTHNHGHDITHTHNHHHSMTHTHTHGHGMAHTHNHFHDMSHVHTHHHTLDHTHPTTIAAGVVEGGMPSGIRLYLNTGLGYQELTPFLGGPWNANFEVQLARYFNDTLNPPEPITGNHLLLLQSSTVGTLEVSLDWYLMLKPVTSTF